jgi:hypothetical protein
MGKKNKKIEIKLSDEELTPSTLGYLEDEKKGPLGLIIIFAIFIIFVLFLPSVTNYINKLMGKDDNIVNSSNTENTEEENDDDSNLVSESDTYEISKDIEFDFNGLKVTNVYLANNDSIYTFNMTITNNNQDSIDMNSEVYYIELYTTEETFIKRYMINKTVINSNESSIISQNISEDSYNSAVKFKIVKRTASDYPEVSLELNSNNQYTLTCKKSGSILVYTFDKNSKLINIKDTFNYPNDNSTNYKNSLALYQNQVANYNNKTGVSSSLVEISTGFTVTTEISVSDVDVSSLNNSNYYDNNTNPKVIKYEMESSDYSCN